MEANYVMSPSGAKYPRTPSNVAAFESGKDSNVKPMMKKTEVEKMKCEKMEALKMNEELKKDVGGFKVEVETYREKMWTTEKNLSEVARLVQDNEDDQRRGMEAERQRQGELEDRIHRLEAERTAEPCDNDALKVRKIELREKDLSWPR